MRTILSLFDGYSGAQQAIRSLGFKDFAYYACEIDKYAIDVCMENHPHTTQMGDVTKVDFTKFKNVHLLVGGSPCQGFSFAGKQLNFEDPRSKLFFEFVRAKKGCKPKYFLLENVMMKKEYQDVISEHLGVSPIEINSRDFTAQNRRRLYWTNIPVDSWEDKGVVLRDILLDEGFGVIKVEGKLRERLLKSQCIDANYFKGVDNHGQRTMVAINYSSSQRTDRVEDRSYRDPDKSHTLTASGYGAKSFTGVVGEDLSIRKLHPIECERLQGLPDNYTKSVSNTQRYKMLGNGFTVPVIAHILRNIFNTIDFVDEDLL